MTGKNSFFSRLPRRSFCVLTVLMLAGCAGAGGQTAMDPNSDSTRIIMNVYAVVTWIDIGIFCAVLIPLIYALIRFRATKGDEISKQVRGTAMLEIAWTLVPALLLILIAVPTWSGISQADDPPAQGRGERGAAPAPAALAASRPARPIPPPDTAPASVHGALPRDPAKGHWPLEPL